MKTHSGSDPGLLLVAPVLFLIYLGCLAVAVLIAWALRRQGAVIRLGERARRRLDRGRALPLLWGLSASVLIVAVSALLFRTHVLALLGVLLLALGLCLTGGGLAVTAWAMGDDLSLAMGGDTDSRLAALKFGLWTLFLAVWVPFVGGLAMLLAAATGLGAVLEALLTREAAVIREDEN